MQIKKGIPVSPGVAMGRTVVIDTEAMPIPKRQITLTKINDELLRVEQAIEASLNDIEQLRVQTEQSVGSELARIFDVHKGMLQDPSLVAQFTNKIKTEHVTAEYAVYSIMRGITQMFEGQKDRYLRERANDIKDIEHRMLTHLIGDMNTEIKHLDFEVILVAHDLTPSQTASLDKTKIKGIATNLGGQTSHTAILAHALGIPAVVGLENITELVTSGDQIMVDGNRGHITITPDADQLMTFRAYRQKIAAFEDSLTELKTLPAETTDGTRINLWANIEFPNEIASALDKGAEGIGLYRTEFLFMGSETEPTEEEQYQTCLEAIKALKGRTLTIRTLDLGADKIWQPGIVTHNESNPFLGCRSIRLCLQNLPLFKTQLRAILRASTQGPVRIMFPLISNIMELRQSKMILTDVMEDLDDQDIAYSENIPVGMMIEVPSAAIQATALSKEVDFFSIGTNDLIQYTVAVDRGNERIANLYSAAHPAVIQLIKDVIRAANRTKIDISLCGEMGGDQIFVMLLLGLGLRNISITPPAIPEVKQIIRNVSIDKCRRIARKVSTFDSDRAVTNYLREELRKIAPEQVYDR